jgi:hypothetical protein
MPCDYARTDIRRNAISRREAIGSTFSHSAMEDCVSDETRLGP